MPVRVEENHELGLEASFCKEEERLWALGPVEELKSAEVDESPVTFGGLKWGRKVKRSPLTVKEPRTRHEDATLLWPDIISRCNSSFN